MPVRLFALCRFMTAESGMATGVKVGTLLEKHGISEGLLLVFEYGYGKSPPTLTKVPKVTNELVLGLFHFLNQHPECTFITLTQWLSCLLCEKWPTQTPPTVKSIRQSVIHLDARYSKLKSNVHVLKRTVFFLRFWERNIVYRAFSWLRVN